MKRRWPLLTLVTLAFVASQGNLLRILGPLEPSIFALQLAFTPEAFAAVLAQWGEAGIARYRGHFAFDLLHPFIYAAFGLAWVRRSGLFLSPAWIGTPLARALPIAGACDLVENALHWVMIDMKSAPLPSMTFASATASSVKWGLAAVFSCAMAAALAGALRRGRPVR